MNDPQKTCTPSTDARADLRGRIAAGAVGAISAAASLPAVALAAPFWAISGATRRLPGLLPLGPTPSEGFDLIEYAEELGCRTRRNLDTFGRADGSYHLTTDDEGWRGRQLLDDAHVLVFGDSFAFGWGVDDEALYTQHVPGLDVKAVGANAYSMVHAVMWMERLAARLAGRKIIWFVYQGNDLYDSLRPAYYRWRMPFLRQSSGQWEIVTDHVSPDPWPIPEIPNELAQLAGLCTPGWESERTLAAADYLIERAAATCRGVDADLTVISVPRREQVDATRLNRLRDHSPDTARFDPELVDRELARSCVRVSVPFIPLSEHLGPSDYQVRDIHWSPAGHRRVGGVLARALS